MPQPVSTERPIRKIKRRRQEDTHHSAFYHMFVFAQEFQYRNTESQSRARLALRQFSHILLTEELEGINAIWDEVAYLSIKTTHQRLRQDRTMFDRAHRMQRELSAVCERMVKGK